MPGKRSLADTRFQPVVDFYFAECERRHGAKPVWDGSDGQALGRLLHSQKQLPVQSLLKLVETAFNWSDAWWGPVRRGDFCPLQPGFRFREFCAHFGKIVCRTNPLSISPFNAAQGGEARRVSVQEIRKVLREYRDRLVGAHDPQKKWEEILGRTLGITYDEACHILSREPMRPDRTGD